jgi:3,4-dihydroxy 2-butanone 4-phosphate synthase/GTP cyclohydrolase II
MPISPIEEAVADIRKGRMIILMDAEDRENEGDLCMAAEKCTPEAIAFMARYGRGLICLPLTEETAHRLGLSYMVGENTAPLSTAFTVSIDTRRGITTGVSAADRCRTILTAIDERSGPEDIRTPGHVFPLIARPGGVLSRTGQTEGGVDLSRLAGLHPSGVICEIMNEDGTMARLADLERFAARHQLKIATIADLIEYRLRHDRLIHRVGEARLPTRYGGEFLAAVYTSDVSPGGHLVLVKGEVRPEEPTLVRVHAQYLPGDVFGFHERDTGALLRRSMELIEAEGKGVILYLRHDRAHLDISEIIAAKEGNLQLPDGTPTPGYGPKMSYRDFGLGAQILRDVGIRKMKLLTNKPPRLVGLSGYGLEIVSTVPLDVSSADAPAPDAPAGGRVIPLR